jgi:hypothetical protein
MNNTIESLNIRLSKQIEELEKFKNDPLSENLEDGIEDLCYEINKTRNEILDMIAFNDSEKQHALKLLAKI